MLEVNNLELKNKIDALNTLISEYEEIQLNIFNQLKDVCINWQDGNSIEFDNKIYLEKEESDLILQALNDKRDILNFIYNKYSDIGKKIKCNLNNKNTLIHSINNCQSQINNILNEFNKIDNSFYYSEYQSIINQKNKIISVKNKMSEVKNSVTKNYDRIEEIENDVKEKINNLLEIKINDFDYTLS